MIKSLGAAPASGSIGLDRLPVFRAGNQMVVTQVGPVVSVGCRSRIAPAARSTQPPGRAGRPAQPSRVASQERPRDGRRHRRSSASPAGDPASAAAAAESRATSTGRIQRSPPSILTTSFGMPTTRLDVANLGLLGKLEDRHVPALERPGRRATQERHRSAQLHHVNPVARKAGFFDRPASRTGNSRRFPSRRGRRCSAASGRIDLAIGVDGVDDRRTRGRRSPCAGPSASSPSSRSV